MASYVVFIKDDESRVIIKKMVTRELSKDLKSKGFRRYSRVIEANSETEVIRKLNKQGEENLDALSQYSGSVFFYCAMLVAGLLVAFVLSN